MPYKVGDIVVAVEDGQFWPILNSPRVPRRLVIEGRITWITSTEFQLRLPEREVAINGELVVLPETNHKLDRFIRPIPWGAKGGEPGAPVEWRYQPFYPKVNGRWCAADMATYYNGEIWKAFNFSNLEQKEPPRDVAFDRCAKVLGISISANRDEIVEAFRERVKAIHPDVGGNPNDFQELIAARNTLLVLNSNF